MKGHPACCIDPRHPLAYVVDSCNISQGLHQQAPAALQFAKATSGPWCGDTATRSPAQAPPMPTLASWRPCPSLSNCLEHRYAGPALQGFSCPAVATLASIGQAGPPWPLLRYPSRPPRGVKRPRALCVSPRDLGNKKHPWPTPGQPLANPWPTLGQPLASTSESQVTRTNSGLAKTAQKSQRGLFYG